MGCVHIQLFGLKRIENEQLVLTGRYYMLVIM